MCGPLLCFKGVQSCFYALIYGQLSLNAKKLQRDKDNRLSLLRAGPSTGKLLHVDLGFLRHTIQLCLERLMPRSDSNVIELIVKFSLPTVPKLALLGSLQLKAHNCTLQNYAVGSGAAFENIIAFDRHFVVSISENPVHVAAWNLSEEGSPCHKVYTGAVLPISSVGVSADANVIVGGCVNGRIHVWNLSSGEATGTCEYYEWSDRWTHYTSVTTVGCGSAYGLGGTDIISGDDIGILCAWQLGQSGGDVKLCVDVRYLLDCSSCRITCTSCQLGLVVCGLHEGFAVGYLTDSSECAFMLGMPLPSAVLAVGLVQTHWTCLGADVVIGCCADGSVLHWKFSGWDKSSQTTPVLPPKFLAHSFSAEAGEEVTLSVANFVKEQEQLKVVWAASNGRPETLHLRWSDINAHGDLFVLGSCIQLARSIGHFRGATPI